MTSGLFETADILRTIRLSRASFKWPCDRRSSNRNEIASFHSSPQFSVRYDTTPVTQCLKPTSASCLALLLSHDDGPLQLCIVSGTRGTKCRLRIPRRIRRITTNAMSSRSGLADLDPMLRGTIKSKRRNDRLVVECCADSSAWFLQFYLVSSVLWPGNLMARKLKRRSGPGPHLWFGCFQLQRPHPSMVSCPPPRR